MKLTKKERRILEEAQLLASIPQIKEQYFMMGVHAGILITFLFIWIIRF